MMNSMKDAREALIRTADGRSVLVWVLVYSVLLVRSIVSGGLFLDQLKYLFFSFIVFGMFCNFRVSSFQPMLKTNMLGFIVVNAFGAFILYKELFK
jgi:hypothetical protein